NIHSFIPTSPPVIDGKKVVADSNIYFGDLIDLEGGLITYANRAAQRGDMVNSRDALLLVSHVSLLPIDLIPASQVEFFGEKVSGYEVYNLSYQPALRGIYLLALAIDAIKPQVKEPQAFNPIEKRLKITIEKLTD